MGGREEDDKREGERKRWQPTNIPKPMLMQMKIKQREYKKLFLTGMTIINAKQPWKLKFVIWQLYSGVVCRGSTV